MLPPTIADRTPSPERLSAQNAGEPGHERSKARYHETPPRLDETAAALTSDDVAETFLKPAISLAPSARLLGEPLLNLPVALLKGLRQEVNTVTEVPEPRLPVVVPLGETGVVRRSSLGDDSAAVPVDHRAPRETPAWMTRGCGVGPIR